MKRCISVTCYTPRVLESTYDIFEVLPDGGLLWKAVAVGHENAVAKLREIAANTENECRVIHVPSNAVIATINGTTG